jgi:hypothetical protein
MGDDRPYLEEHDGRTLLELPVHWSLDDHPYFGWRPESPGPLAAPDDVLQTWLTEVASAVVDRRHVTLTMHPEVIGRGVWFGVLGSLVERLDAMETVWLANHRDVVRLLARA